MDGAAIKEEKRDPFELTNKKYPPLQKLQLSLDADNTRDYLDHDSCLDCSQLYERHKHILKEKCISDTSIYPGQLSDTDVDTGNSGEEFRGHDT